MNVKATFNDPNLKNAALNSFCNKQVHSEIAESRLCCERKGLSYSSCTSIEKTAEVHLGTHIDRQEHIVHITLQTTSKTSHMGGERKRVKVELHNQVCRSLNTQLTPEGWHIKCLLQNILNSLASHINPGWRSKAHSNKQ